MDQAEILKRLTKIVGQVVGQEGVVLTPETTAEDIGGWDSFNHINITIGAEMEFGIKFNTSDLEQLRNVGEFVALIEKRLANKK